MTTKDWKQNVKNAMRSILVSITNSTTHALVRHKYGLDHGLWSEFPPEKIPPNTTVEFGSQSHSVLNGTEGGVVYSIDGNPELGDFIFSWNISLFGSRTCQAESPNQLFVIKENATLNAVTEVKWVVEFSPNKSNQSSLVKSLSAIKAVPDWRNSISQATRAVICNIDNQTRHKLVRKSHELSAGGWALVPPETIGPNTNLQFAARSRGIMTGVWGKIEYSIAGSEDLIGFDFSNPFVGSSSFNSNTKYRGIQIESKVEEGSHANVTYKIIMAANKAKIETSERNTFKIMTLNTVLHVTRDGVLQVRTEPLIKKLNDGKYDILCLQGVYKSEARKLLAEKLQLYYPYNAESSLYTSYSDSHASGDGLYIFSRFPILQVFDKAFTNGLFADAKRGKGILGAKLDLSSVCPRKVMYVFSTHLQSNPIPGSAIEIEKAAAIREEQFKLIKTFILRSVAPPKNTLTTDMGVMLCGDFELPAEITPDYSPKVDLKDSTNNQNVPQQELQPVDQFIKDILTRINSKELNFSYALELPILLKQMDVPKIYLAVLREGVESPRVRLLLLIAMIWEVVQEHILARLKSLGVKTERAKKAYLDTSLLFLNLLVGNEFLIPDPIFAVSGETEVDAFWGRICLETLDRIFEGKGISEKEKNKPRIMLEQVTLYRFQMIKMFEENTGVSLKKDSRSRILKEERPVIKTDDVEDESIEDNRDLWNAFQLQLTVGSPLDREINKTCRLVKTSEYSTALSALNCYDAYREKNPNKVGWTLLAEHNKLLLKNTPPSRNDFIFYWDVIGEPDNMMKLNPLSLLDCKVLPFGDSADTQLSSHFAVEAVFSVTK